MAPTTTPLLLLAQQLREAGYSLTKPRKQVFEAMLDAEPMSLHELSECLKGTVDRTSIYRTTRLFETLSIVQRLYVGWKYQLELSDAYIHHHHHATCTSCGLIAALQPDARLETYLDGIAQSSGFHMAKHTLEVRGLCSACYSEKHKTPAS
jgi:Fe2+ or Zn2+ uptake regulation protein